MVAASVGTRESSTNAIRQPADTARLMHMVMTRPSSSWDHQTVCMSMPTMPPQFHTGGGGSCGGAGAAGDAMLKKTDRTHA